MLKTTTSGVENGLQRERAPALNLKLDRMTQSRCSSEASSGQSASGNSNDPLQIFIVDDHPAIREALASAINLKEDMEAIGSVGTVEEALSRIREDEPHVIVVDISLEDGDGLTLIDQIRANGSDAGILVYSMYDESVYAERALRAGALGYIPKSESTEEVMNALRSVAQGEVYLSDPMASKILSKVIQRQDYAAAPLEQLTDRELTVFRMLGEGASVREIADQLDLSRKTIETYRRRAKEKLGYDTVQGLLRFAVQWAGEGSTEQNSGVTDAES